MTSGRMGLLLVGLAGAVGTTVHAGLDLLRTGAASMAGLPLREQSELVPYGQIVMGGWDVAGTDLATAARRHKVLTNSQFALIERELSLVKPWPAILGIGGGEDGSAPAAIERIRRDIVEFAELEDLERVVVVNVGPTESLPPDADSLWPTPFELTDAIAQGDSRLPTSTLYAYAAVSAGAAYANFTPSLGASVDGLVAMAEAAAVPLAGRDGKTGQTLLKTVLASAFRARDLRVQGWYSLNLLGNDDGANLSDPVNVSSKITTKAGSLEAIVGYPVPDHTVRIDYHPPRGDAKEAWDAIDLVGFLDQEMALKIDFLCRDSILAAPLVIEIARCLEFALRAGQGGVIEELGFFFKAPMTRAPDHPVEHNLFEQERVLRRWLAHLSDGAR